MVPIVTTVHRYWIYSYINIFSDISNLSIIFKLIYNVGTSFLKKKKNYQENCSTFACFPFKCLLTFLKKIPKYKN